MKIKDRARPKTPPVEPGVYVAVCVGVIDLGEQYSEKYKKYSNDIKFVWELSGETVETDGEQKPRTLSRDLAASISKKGNMRGVIESWNGKKYTDEEFAELDLFDQLGKACQLNVVLNDTGEYANVDSVIPLPKGMAAPAPGTPFIKWDMDKWDEEVFATLPDWIQEKIKGSTQYQKLHAPEDALTLKEQGAGGKAEEVCPI